MDTSQLLIKSKILNQKGKIHSRVLLQLLFLALTIFIFGYLFFAKTTKKSEAQCAGGQSCTWQDWYCVCGQDPCGDHEMVTTYCVKCEDGVMARTTFLNVPYTRSSSGELKCSELDWSQSTLRGRRELDGAPVEVKWNTVSCP